MYEADVLAVAAEFRALGSRLAALLTPGTSGAVAAEALDDVLAGVRAGELATCRAIERVDRTREYATDGAASTAAYLRNLSGKANGWVAERVLLGRALTDRMPATGAGW